MSLYAAVGVGQGEDSHVAGVMAAQEALDRIGLKQADLFLVFASAKYDQEKVISGIRSVGKNTLVVGCSSAGEITSDGPIKKSAVTVMAFQSDTVRFHAAVGETITANPREAGKRVAQVVKDHAGGRIDAFIMFPDVLAGNGSEILRGAQDVFGPHFPIVGGAPGDDFKFEQTYQYLNDKVYSGAVVAVGISGNFKMGVGVAHGWVPIGLPKKVTKSAGSILYELDGKPAISLYDDYFGDAAKALRTEKLARLALTYPIGIKTDDSGEMLIRDPLTVDQNGAITLCAEVPEGSEIQLMIGSKEEAIKVAREAAHRAVDQLDGSHARAVLIFDSFAHNKLLAGHNDQEIYTVQEATGKSVPLMGFYTYGEIAPIGGEVRNIPKCNPVFHNETIVICVLGD